MKKRLNLIYKKLAIIVLFLVMILSFQSNIVKTRGITSMFDASVDGILYARYLDAWNAVSQAGGTIEALSDWDVEEVLVVGENITINLNMNGHVINRNLSSSIKSGEIFLVEANATFNIEGGDSSIVHYGTVINGRWIYQRDGTGNHPVNGGIITGGNNSNGGGAIHIKKSATVNINNASITGNVCADDCMGGAIRLQGDNSKLNLTKTTLSYNASILGGGGALWVEGVDSQVVINSSSIHHNESAIEYGDGGAIQINNGTVTINNSNLLFNRTPRRGGAIYISNGNLIIDSQTNISNNQSYKEGGAIYIDKNADNVEIRGTLSGNKTKEEGGAIYVNNSINGVKGLKLTDAEVLGNYAGDAGGGVYVDSDNNFKLSNKVVINGNTPDDLYITNVQNINNETLSSGSKIGLNTSLDKNSNNVIKASYPQYFYSNDYNYEIVKSSNGFYLNKIKASRPEVYVVNDYEYKITSHNIMYRTFERSNDELTIYYSDGFFAESAKYYNSHLASLTMAVAMSAGQSIFEGTYSEAKAASNILSTLVSLGFSDITYYYPEPEFYGFDEEVISTIGYAIGKKVINIAGQDVTLIATVIRGAGYAGEWGSNVILGSGLGEAKGFNDAAKQVQKGLNSYIEEHNIDGSSSKFWLAGFSRSAATANIVSKNLTDIYGEDNIYAYCYEAPQGGSYYQLNDDRTYTNIHNIINFGDFVTLVGPKEMGFIRYGVDHYIPQFLVGSSEYKSQKKIMLSHLENFADHIEFDDYFHEATIEYFHNYTGASDLISKNYFVDYENSEIWLPKFIEKLLNYSFNYQSDNRSIYDKDSDAWNGYRNYWSSFKWYLLIEDDDLNIISYEKLPVDYVGTPYVTLTLEQAVSNLMSTYFGMSKEKQQQIIASIDLDELKGKIDLSDIYFNVIGEWNTFTIIEKNSFFNDIWNKLDLESELSEVFTPQEFEELKCSVYVLVDVLLDFISEDYRKSDQDFLGTFAYNVGNIFKTHIPEIGLAWLRSYDSYYSDVVTTCNHNYEKWTVLQEVSEEGYGIKVSECTKCHEEIYEIIPQEAAGIGTLIGKGSIITIVCMTLILSSVGVIAYFINKRNKKLNN